MTGKMVWAYMGMSNRTDRGSFEGVFKRDSAQLNDANMCDASAFMEKPSYIGFDASLGNSLYTGTTLQVQAMQCLVCIKI